MLKTLAAALIATAMIAGPALAAQGTTTGQASGAEPKMHKTHHMRHHVKHTMKHKHKHHHMAKAKAPKADK
jgi:hypothetical protein